jgi:hypothetical protein
MKTWREQFKNLAQINTEQAITIAALKRKINRLEGQVEAIISRVNRIR